MATWVVPQDLLEVGTACREDHLVALQDLTVVMDGEDHGKEILMLMMLTWMVWPSQDRLTSTKASSVFKSSNALTMLEWKPALNQLIFQAITVLSKLAGNLVANATYCFFYLVSKIE